jgi:hypothetical protein
MALRQILTLRMLFLGELKKESACIDSIFSPHDSLDLPLSGTNLSSKFASMTARLLIKYHLQYGKNHAELVCC